jgi:hypothetical protein
MKLLRAFPPLDATSTLALCRDFVKKLPVDLYDRLARHVRQHAACHYVFRLQMLMFLYSFYNRSPGIQACRLHNNLTA